MLDRIAATWIERVLISSSLILEDALVVARGYDCFSIGNFEPGKSTIRSRRANADSGWSVPDIAHDGEVAANIDNRVFHAAVSQNCHELFQY